MSPFSLAVVAMATVAVAVMLMPKQEAPSYAAVYRVPMNVSSMLSHVSARVAQAVLPKKISGVVDAHTVYPSIAEGVVDLVDCPGAASDGNGWRSMGETAKAQCASATVSWLKTHPEAVVMIFAPWCDHCHRAMPGLGEAVSATGFPALMVNAEAVPRALLQGDTALYQCEYFPTFLAKKGDKVVAAKSPAEAAQLLVAASEAKSPAPPATPAPPPQAVSARATFLEEEAPKETMDDVFGRLFA